MQGRFLTDDPWQGKPNHPMSYNDWLYVYGNPVNLTDPSGKCSQDIQTDRECWRVWGQAMTAFEDAPVDLDNWDTPHLQVLTWWTSRGIRFSSNDDADQRRGNVGSSWTNDNITAVLSALNRSEAFLGNKLLPAFGLKNGTLTFNKWAGVAPGGFYRDETNSIDVLLPDNFIGPDARESAVETIVHELGHSLDHQLSKLSNRGADYYSLTFWGTWQHVCGWSFQNELWSQSDKGQTGASSIYAMTDPREDFAETFSTAVLGHPRRFSPLGANPRFSPAEFQIRLGLLNALIRGLL